MNHKETDQGGEIIASLKSKTRKENRQRVPFANERLNGRR